MVVISDGAQNAGVDAAAAIKAAQEARIPIYAIGIGSANRPTNVRVSDLVAPARAYPGDRFQVTGYVQAQGLAGRTVTVEIAVVIPKEGPNGHEESVWDSAERVTLGGDSETVPVRFDVPGIENAGRRVIRLRVKSIAEDKDPTDNQREVDVDIVDRKNRVLLFATCCGAASWPRAAKSRSIFCCNRPKTACRKMPMKFSTSFPARCKRYRSTTRSSLSILIGDSWSRRNWRWSRNGSARNRARATLPYPTSRATLAY